MFSVLWTGCCIIRLLAVRPFSINASSSHPANAITNNDVTKRDFEN